MFASHKEASYARKRLLELSASSQAGAGRLQEDLSAVSTANFALRSSNSTGPLLARRGVETRLKNSLLSDAPGVADVGVPLAMPQVAAMVVSEAELEADKAGTDPSTQQLIASVQKKVRAFDEPAGVGRELSCASPLCRIRRCGSCERTWIACWACWREKRRNS
jgi:hypothetical protein